MYKKFTEEQYQKIVNLQEDEYRFSILGGGDDYNYGFWRRLIIVAADIASFANENKLIDELAALANPLTREWAHDKFVDEEKQYIWYSKKFCLHNGDFKNNRLFKEDCGVVISAMRTKTDITSELNYLTEKEVREWGYNPEMFDKEEVD